MKFVFAVLLCCVASAWASYHTPREFVHRKAIRDEKHGEELLEGLIDYLTHIVETRTSMSSLFCKTILGMLDGILDQCGLIPDSEMRRVEDLEKHTTGSLKDLMELLRQRMIDHNNQIKHSVGPKHSLVDFLSDKIYDLLIILQSFVETNNRMAQVYLKALEEWTKTLVEKGYRLPDKTIHLVHDMHDKATGKLKEILATLIEHQNKTSKRPPRPTARNLLSTLSSGNRQ